jgi:hypothetical protein
LMPPEDVVTISTPRSFAARTNATAASTVH